MAEEITLTIDGRQVTVPKGTLVLNAAKKLGISIPVFCYHDKLAPVGACRQCLVDIEGMPKPQVSCSTEVAEGMVVRTDTPEVAEMWKSVVEFLLINHPLDCPVCDRGGECPLQDNTFNYGPMDSRFEHEKRHFEKPVPLSALVLLDRERCIQCFRCVRFQKEIPDHPQIQMHNRGYGDYIDIFPGRPFESNFSGNTIELCPVGALLSSVFRFRARPWEIAKTESVCPNCGVGCNITIDARNSRRVVRYLSRENPDVDDGWLCDQGRFDSAYINSPERLTTPLVRKNGELVEATWEEAITAAVEGMLCAGGEHAAGLGSDKRTNEQNYLFQRFMRLVVGTNNIDYTIQPRAQGGTDAIASGLTSGLFDGSIRDITASDVIIALGSDITHGLPVLDLWVQKAVRQLGRKLIMAYPLRPPLADYAASYLRYRYGSESEFAVGLAAAIKGNAPDDAAGVPKADLEYASGVISGANSVIILVSQEMIERAEGGRETLGAIGLIVEAIRKRGGKASVMLLSAGANAQGAMDVGLLPGYYPGYQRIGPDTANALKQVWGTAPPTTPGLSGWEIIQSAANGDLKSLWIMGQDPVTDVFHGGEARSALARLDALVVQDYFLTETAKMAHVVLPGCTLAEAKGTLTNTERRVQRIMPAIRRVGDSKVDTDIILLAAFHAEFCHPERQSKDEQTRHTEHAEDKRHTEHTGEDRHTERSRSVSAFEFGRIEAIFDEMAKVIPVYSEMTFDSVGPKGRQWEARA